MKEATPIRRLFTISRPYLKYFAGGILAAGIVSLLDLSLALALKKFIELGSANLAQATKLLRELCVMIVGIYAGKWFFSYQQTVLLSAGIYKLTTDLRGRLYNHLHVLSISFFDRQRTGQIMSRMTNDVGVVQSSGSVLTDLVTGPVLGLGGLVGMLYLNWRLTIAAVLVVPVMAVAIARIGGKMRSLSSVLQTRLADLTEMMEETIAGMRIIKSFAAEDYEMRRFSDCNREGYYAAMRGVKRSAALQPTVELIGAFGTIGILLYGGWFVARDQMTMDALGAFVFLMVKVATSARMIGRINIQYQTVSAAAERIFEILDDRPDVAEPQDARPPGDIRGQITFESVSFSYSGETDVIRDLSFEIAPGEIVALVGPSGAGKSTIASLIPRFYDPNSGAVRIDGQDVRGLLLTPLRRQIAIVPQETMLFAASIRENIAYGRRDATTAEIEEAARAAHAHDFIVKTENGYDTVLGDRGTRISQGQRQRIAIARAILADPAILILDEATSSLDAESERLVQEALERLMSSRTTLIIAHRLATITKADRIFVLERGRMVECGAFDELMRGNTLFRKLYEVQHRLAEASAHEN
ncbi:MAG: ABC transporter ATP-binding protein [Armatimonadetes bacterium]|nr:ABC transporter ATP-binding protein [Armatimonadota bacterium]